MFLFREFGPSNQYRVSSDEENVVVHFSLLWEKSDESWLRKFKLNCYSINIFNLFNKFKNKQVNINNKKSECEWKNKEGLIIKLGEKVKEKYKVCEKKIHWKKI